VKKKTKKVVIGGTFDILHKGHEALLRRAFGLGEVEIGLTSDKMAREIRNREIKNFKERKRELKNFIIKELKAEPKIIKIEDEFGFTLERDFDYIVVSPETYQTALEINGERKKKNKKPIEIVKIDFVLAEDGKPISAERIAKGEINEKGELLK
jgi:pantetheine-phosphate adenylyltransferase